MRHRPGHGTPETRENFMPTSSTCLRTVFAICACGLLLAPVAAADPSRTDVQQIERETQDLEYQLSWQVAPQLKGVESAWQAANRAQGMRSFFTDDGLRVLPRLESQAAHWQVGFSLIGYGRDSWITGLDSADLVVDEKRIDYRRGRVTEWYVNEPRGLEQGFDLEAPPRETAEADRSVPGARRAGADGEAYLVLTIEGSLSPRISVVITPLTPSRRMTARIASLSSNGANSIRAESLPVSIITATWSSWMASSSRPDCEYFLPLSK